MDRSQPIETSFKTDRQKSRKWRHMWVNACREVWEGAACTWLLYNRGQYVVPFSYQHTRSAMLFYICDKCTNNIKETLSWICVLYSGVPALHSPYVKSHSCERIHEVLASYSLAGASLLFTETFQTVFYLQHEAGKISIWIVWQSC